MVSDVSGPAEQGLPYKFQPDLTVMDTQALQQLIYSQQQQLAELQSQNTCAQVEVERARQIKTEFMARISHELRTPLNAIIGFGDLLSKDAAAFEPRHREQLGYIVDSGQHLLLLINEILDISKMEAGQLKLQLGDCSLDKLITKAMEMVQPLAISSGVVLSPPPAGLPYIYGDQQRLLQVLVNLFSNAIKYNSSGGRVWLCVTDSPQQRVRVEIHDSGIGIATEALSRLFEPFSRLRGITTLATEGTGIGLAISKGLIEQMGGSIGVSSEEGRGSLFWFELPRVLEPVEVVAVKESHMAAVVRERPHHRRSLTVLCVEDNLVNMVLLEAMLKRIGGLTIIKAITAEAGLEIAWQQPLDLILMDIELPGMDGYQALAELKHHPQTRDIPVLALSAHALADHLQRAEGAAFATYLTKPLDLKLLQQALLPYQTRSS